MLLSEQFRCKRVGLAEVGDLLEAIIPERALLVA